MASLSSLPILIALAAPLLALSGGLTGDGETYLAEAKRRIERIERSVADDAKDAGRAAASTDDLLASKRFLDNVQLEQPKHKEAAELQRRADRLLDRLQPALVRAAIERRLAEIAELTASIEKDLAGPRDARGDERLRERFEMLRNGVRSILEKEPANAAALAARDRENELWRTFREQREAARGTP